MLDDFTRYLDTYGHQIGVLLVEPQWGSSVAAMPWPPALLRAYIQAAKARGIAVVSDEIMCGLGRHGAEPSAGGTGCFLAECWDLQPDIVTFGKSIGGGAGHLLSGAVLLHSASKLQSGPQGTAFQSHTYAGSSSRALANGAALLNSMESWRPSVRAIGDAISPIISELNEASAGAVIAHGQGALWGGLFAHADRAARTAANMDFKKRCAEARVLPYFVPVGGFMLTPRYDDEPEVLAAAVKEMAQCALETSREMGWAPSALLPLGAPDAVAAPPPPRYKGPEAASLDPTQKAIYEEIDRTRTTSATRGPYLPWLASPALADAAQNLGRICRYETTLSQREAELVILATAYANRAAAEWSVHVGEARKAGLEDAHIAALARGAPPAFAGGSRESAIYAVTADLLEHKRASDESYSAAVAALGEKGVVELVSIVGYYTYVALTLNTFEIADPLLTEGVNPKAPWEADAAYDLHH